MYEGAVEFGVGVHVCMPLCAVLELQRGSHSCLAVHWM